MSRTNVSNNNVNIAGEVYEKVRPLQKTFNNDQGRGDDLPVQSPSKLIELQSTSIEFRFEK